MHATNPEDLQRPHGLLIYYDPRLFLPSQEALGGVGIPFVRWFGTDSSSHRPDLRVGGKYRLGKKIGSGSFGDIYLGINIISGEEVAIELESVKARHPQLTTSIWFGAGCDDLDPFLEGPFNVCNRKFSLKSVLLLADQLEWEGGYFRKTTLKEFGPAHRDFTVLHDNGIHNVAVDFCGCHLHGQTRHDRQLLQMRWFPSTNNRPQTCATFTCLDKFHALTLHSKCTPYDYYEALEYLTDGSGLNKPLNRYRPWLRMQRQYRHLLLLKRRGRGHAESGAAGTAIGELAIRCPVCPRPGVNLPDDWADAPPEDQGLYTQFFAIDACFSLKRRLISNDIRDPPLGSGFAYMVEWEPYRQHILNITDEKEMSNCSEFAALDYAKYQILEGVCGDRRRRRAFARATSLCNRRALETSNEASALATWTTSSRLSYDTSTNTSASSSHMTSRVNGLWSLKIACASCRSMFGSCYVANSSSSRCQKCTSKGTFCRVKSVTRWLFCSARGKQTARASSGFGRQSRASQAVRSCPVLAPDRTNSTTIGSFGIGESSLAWRSRCDAKQNNAKLELERQEDAFTSFCIEQSEHVPRWLAMVYDFEADESKPNPYAPATTDGLTEAQVRAQLDEQDQLDAANGVLPLHEVTPTEFISFGLDDEEEQRRLVVQAELKKAKQKTGDKIRLKPGRRKFKTSYDRWRELQATYMPSASLHFSGLNLPADTLLENTPLLLPSALTPETRDGPGCKAGLVEIESRLRHAQCKTSLVRLRAQLHIKKQLLIYKKNHSRHQGANTRSRALIARNEAKVKGFADCYQAARAALCRIEENVVWPVLKAADIRCMEDTDDLTKREAQRRRQQERRARQLAQLLELGVITREQMDEGLGSDDEDDSEENTKEKQPGEGESRRQISWIWTSAATTGSEQHLQEGSFYYLCAFRPDH
ncbi:hypothetical protein HMN09_00425900 [Mycena chlorophos]|uniref:CxC2-like cysteine cluster KDZ transposase-associated domain-containing protein n=1 Tax=Mycena chlorophos TaxID=658473 RepID=A0A8H6TE24_MYCCL|nr:hypothetical protein HMN09_00425900 [Mycena chlorophos]